MIRLIAIDIDGTLLDSRHQIPAANIDALAEAASRGIAIVLATGRNYHFTTPVARQLPVPLTFICNNGACVKDGTGATLKRRVMDQSVARAILDVTADFDDSVAVVFDRADDRHILYDRMDWSHQHRKGYYAKNEPFIHVHRPLADALVEDPIQVMFNGSVAPMRRLVGRLHSMPEADRFTVAVTEYEPRDFSLIDVNGPGTSKGSMLAEWAAASGLDRREVMAVGDNLNDVEMLEYAGAPVLMGNATAALKARGFPVTGTNDDAGLAQAIRRLFV